MKKIGKKIAIVTLLALSLCGCAEKQEDTYMEGTDYQYMYKDLENIFPRQAKGEEGYYLLNGKFIYYINKEENAVMPLCNKPNCLHNQETEESRYQSCNGYVENNGMIGIAYCDGYLYYVSCKFDEKNMYELYRVKEDGSVKELVHQWNDSTIKQWIVHRNKFYFVEVTYETQEDGEIGELYAVKELDLKKALNGKETVIYEPEENLVIEDIAWPSAYGNHLYFDVFAYTASDDVVTNDNYQDYLYMKTFEYNLTDKKFHEIESPEEGFVQNVTFYKDKLLVHPWNPEKEMEEQQTCYITDLDGSNSEVFMENALAGENFIWDGTYLYVGNRNMISEDNPVKQIYKVYNEQLEKIDEIAMAFENVGDPSIGDGLGMFLVFTDENAEQWTLEYFDKSTLGQYQGKAFSTNVIAEMEYQEYEKE